MDVTLKTIQVNFGGDAKWGSIHCCEKPTVAVPEVYTYVAGNTTPLRGVFVPSRMAIWGYKMQVTVEITGVTETCMVAPKVQCAAATCFYGQKIVFFASTISNDGTYQFLGLYRAPTRNPARATRYDNQYTFSYTTGLGQPDVEIGTVNCISYTLESLPLAPFDASAATYIATKTNYVPTALLDFLTTALTKLPESTTVTALTQYLNKYTHFTYDTAGLAHYACFNGVTYGICLNKWLEHYYNDKSYDTSYYLNCSDCAAIVQIAARAGGIECYSADMRATLATGFTTNLIITIGGDKDGWATAFGTQGFGYHCVNVLTPLAAGTTVPSWQEPVYDACLSIDAGNNPTKTVPDSGSLALVPCNYEFAQTSEASVERVNGSYTAAYYRPRLVAQGNTCAWSYQYALAYLDSNMNNSKEEKNLVAAPVLPHVHQLKERLNLLQNPFGEAHFTAASMPLENPVEIQHLLPEGVQLRIDDDGQRYKDWVFHSDQSVHRVYIICTLDEKDLYDTLVSTLSGYTCPNICPYEKLEHTVAFWSESDWVLFVRGCQIILIASDQAEKIAHDMMTQ